MILYHGSDKIIKKPFINGGRVHNDYGSGFYCTEFPDMAREWSVGAGQNGYLNCYDFDLSGLSVIDLNDHSILTWLAVLLQNRTFTIETPLAASAKDYIVSEFGTDYLQYDVIRGYRADDSYFSFAQDFLCNVISYQQLKKSMYLGDLGEQIVLKSAVAYEHIKFSYYENVPMVPWLERKNERDAKARKAYFSIDRDSYVPGGIYIVNILDERMRKDDPRLR
ncbi:MAG: DUF3990 domain-containing protein [Lachnospiraceae bacterium]|nr:DUF3990 domain-containing protein [Lachnospiraceae bacterium]